MTYASTRTQRQRDSQTVYTSIDQVSEKTVILNKLRGIRICKRIFDTPCKVFQKASTNLQNNNLSKLLQTPRTRTEDTHQGYNNDNRQEQFRIKDNDIISRLGKSVVSLLLQQNWIQCFNCKGFGHYAKECRKPKRVKDYSYRKEKMMMCKQAEHSVPLQAKQADWLADTDEEIDEQELEAHYSFMAKIQEVLPEESSSTEQPLEQKDDSNVTPDSSNICNNDNQVDQNAAECVDERAALANLIVNLSLDTKENKMILKQLKKANASLTQELKECRTNLDELDLKAQMQDKNIATSELKKLVEKCKGKSVETHFDKPYVVRQPNAQRIPIPSVLGKPTPFSNSPKMRSFQTKQLVNKTNVSDGLFKQVTQQNLPQNRKQAEIHSNVLKPGIQVKFKKKEVEDHHRISSISKKTKSITACNDSLNSRTSNVNAVFAECGKCMFNSNHDACVSRYLNDVNARTKNPNIVPISASKPKRKINKSVATPHKKTVASDTTIQKSKSYYKELYENTNQEWKLWIAKKCPSGYNDTKPHRRKKI
ncbi:integrase, catalytic region, zinc finger, CCHC-type containing protein [Tanacetum coccineum]